MKKITCLLLILHVSLVLSAQERTILLKDGTEINATVVINNNQAPSVMLLHQCNRDQSMWQSLTPLLHKQGYNTLTVDMRGYGKSKSATFDISRAYDDARNEETQQREYDNVTKHFKNDIDDVNDFWRKELPESITRIVIGASCGGAQATKSAAMNDDIKAMVVISPSLRTHWIDPKDKNAIQKRNELPILALASEEDTNALNSIKELFDHNESENSQMMVYKGRLHGEPLFTHDPRLLQYITDWLVRVID